MQRMLVVAWQAISKGLLKYTYKTKEKIGFHYYFPVVYVPENLTNKHSRKFLM